MMKSISVRKNKKGRVAIVIPPTSDDTSVVRDYAGGLGFEPISTYVLPPLDMLQMAAIASQDWEVSVHDFSWHKNGDEVAITEVIQNSPSIALVQASLSSILSDLDFSRQLKKKGVRSLIRLQYIPVGFLERINSQLDDEWIVGECEATLLDILDGEDKPGLITNNQDNVGRPAFIDDLDSLPFPSRELVLDIPYEYPRLGRCITLQASRGCPHSCGYYCPYPLVQGKRWRKRSTQSLIDELVHAFHGSDVRKVFFRDAVFTLDTKRTESLCTEILKQKIKFQWWCETRADLLPEKTIELMSQAGCVGINIGVETGDEALRLANLKSNVDNQCVQRTCDYLHLYGIDVSLLMMIGWPGETRLSLMKTAELIISCKPRSVGLVFPTAYFGTSFREDIENQGLLSADEFPTNGFTPQVPSATMTFAEMVQGKNLVQSVINAVCNNNGDNLSAVQALSDLECWVNQPGQ
jgi:anaerobic magnesium-protoporphyrin IX monomethyl ester cyclase